ncbi:glycine betaine/proline transport system substrate-binding protein [Methanomicrobium sp. W14]|uniref:glycine betaine ABC transporter substrate-binding protein n=1 Tax=Methanomicrobium sp. W14 TaxID=2817839 RepID=UPI001FD95586|nr:glycine betaine ABC transporter substrate-binding protein [Methanomicrobium sp. W14]MBP2133245.1 glycine betaine/proline transport system substrate-binding protein [Methanomicrobium sp. W14]
MEKKIKFLVAGIVVLFSIILVAGCTGNTPSGQTSGNATATAVQPEDSIKIGYVLWDSEIASTKVLKQIYEKAGYNVKLVAVDAGPLYQALAGGDVDLSISAWLPTTQANYWEKFGDDIDFVGHNLDGAKIGLVVPSYVNISSIDELNSVSDEFDKTITGIEPGAGIMSTTEKAIDEYGLDYTLLSSSSAGMTAQLTKAIKENESIVVTGWTPHWMFARFDLKYLDDPKGVFGGEEYIGSLARKGLFEDNPKVYSILKRFYWEPSDMNSVMFDIENGMSDKDAAAKWISDNPEKVKEIIGDDSL